jgi:GNT-I family
VTSAVALFIFNRADTTRQVLAQISRYRPKKLLVIGDGPRDDSEQILCAEARAVIAEVDWDCEVLTDYSLVNMGCKHRVASGLAWVFNEVEEAIILEDDCVPDPSFFTYCDDLLIRYRDDKRVMAISGDNFEGCTKKRQESYYFSRWFHCWGWATWRRAWKKYDPDILDWPQLSQSDWLADVLTSEQLARYWSRIFDAVYAGLIDTWDYQWMFATWAEHSLTIVPAVNLVSNIGFRADATHTKDGNNARANIPTQSLTFPLVHPPRMVKDRRADISTFLLDIDSPRRSALKPALLRRWITSGRSEFRWRRPSSHQ